MWTLRGPAANSLRTSKGQKRHDPNDKTTAVAGTAMQRCIYIDNREGAEG